ncbi:hypothetical protein HYH02_010393 [Chlamydomonas schloesseri]|uniref:Uncharacterized protein n=1 Tax=Chlamydomonas schloesseri TaxID=2026947 RepID=A0A835W5U3_9CHLO|nr:hypothetical protein HYH02_010393 [Chlamydomonas schloesseri]|eukprot:KAG2440515.1 hypothetical protein HYH02_010393 [Chlamydomonas schloesseri]
MARTGHHAVAGPADAFVSDSTTNNRTRPSSSRGSGGSGSSSTDTGAGGGSSSHVPQDQLLLALADSCELQVWRVPLVPSAVAGAAAAAGPHAAASAAARRSRHSAVGDGPSGDGSGTGSAGWMDMMLLQPQLRQDVRPPPQPLVRAAACPLPRHALIYSLAWIPPAGGAATASVGASTVTETAAAAAAAAAAAGQGRGTSTSAAAAAGGNSCQEVRPAVLLAAGTHQGAVEWYAYEEGGTEGGGSGGSAGVADGSSSCLSESLRLIKTTTCGSNQPLVDLHFLPSSSSPIPMTALSSPLDHGSGSRLGADQGRAATAAGAGLWGGDRGGGGSGSGSGGSSGTAVTGCRGVLVGLQDASFALAGVGGARNAIQLFDVGTMAHLATVVDPFESHEFMCCCPIASAARAGGGGGAGGGGCSVSSIVDPHVLMVGSVHGSFCSACYQYGLPSLCHHKARSATAALSTLDVRCGGGGGRCGLTQRFGLHHRSLYPRLATAREHFVFTSHAGTPLEVHDRRAMSAPLFSLAHLPRPSLGEVHQAAASAAAVAAAAATAVNAARGAAPMAALGSGSTRMASGVVAAWSHGAGASASRPGAGWAGPDGGTRPARRQQQRAAAGRPPRPGRAVPGGRRAHADASDATDEDGDGEESDGGEEEGHRADAEEPEGERGAAAPTAAASKPDRGVGLDSSFAGRPRTGLAAGARGLAAARHGRGEKAEAGACSEPEPEVEMEETEEGQESGEAVEEALPPLGWTAGYAAAQHEHQGLWLEASEDVLLGRADNGAVFVWDLSTVLGWAAGPERSGLWHYLSEYGSGGGGGTAGAGVAAATAAAAAVARTDTGGGGGVEGQSGREEDNDEGEAVEMEEEEEDAAGRQRRLQRHGMPACLGWVECAGTMPVASLSPGNPLALFTLGAEPSGREYLVASVMA